MTRRELALQLLKDAGDDGVTTAQLLNEGVGSRYGARLMELREEGYEILCVRVGPGSHRYTLLAGDPPPVGPARSTRSEGAHRGGGIPREHLSPLVSSPAAAPSSCEGRLFELPAESHWRAA